MATQTSTTMLAKQMRSRPSFSRATQRELFCQYTRKAADFQADDKMSERALLVTANQLSQSQYLLDPSTFQIKRQARRLPGSMFSNAEVYTDTLPVAALNDGIFRLDTTHFPNCVSAWPEVYESGATRMLFQPGISRDDMASRKDEFISQPPTKVLEYTWRFHGTYFEEDIMTVGGCFYDEEGIRIKHLLDIMRSYHEFQPCVFVPEESWMHPVRMLFVEDADIHDIIEAAEHDGGLLLTTKGTMEIERQASASVADADAACSLLDVVMLAGSADEEDEQKTTPPKPALLDEFMSADSDGEANEQKITPPPQAAKQYQRLRRGLRRRAPREVSKREKPRKELRRCSPPGFVHDLPTHICGSAKDNRRLKERAKRVPRERGEALREAVLTRNMCMANLPPDHCERRLCLTIKFECTDKSTTRMASETMTEGRRKWRRIAGIEGGLYQRIPVGAQWSSCGGAQR